MFKLLLEKFLPKNITVFFATAFVAEILSEIILKLLGQNLSQVLGVVFDICIAYIVDNIFLLREKKIIALEHLNKTWQDSSKSNSISKDLFEIASKEYPPQIEKQIHKLNESSGLLLDNAEELYSQWKTKINQDIRWRLLLHRILNSNIKSVRDNNFSLPLSNYLQILLDTIDMSITWADEENNTLFVCSFTNALPKDWFHESNPVVGSSMENYSSDLSKLISLMKTKGYVYSRYILCSDSDYLAARGFHTKRQVINDWKQRSAKERDIYLKEFHSDQDFAFIVDLYPEIQFTHNYTELIYFGFRKNDIIAWKWCLGCSYTNENLNVTATFLELEKDCNENIIFVENVRQLRNGKMKIPHMLKISFSDFPSKINDENYIGKIEKIKNILPLADKWDLAASIWHGMEEENMLKKLIEHEFPKGASLLDAACGTGFHAICLKNAGFNLIASDFDENNIEILKHKLSNLEIDFPLKQLDWQNLQNEYNNEFDGVLCLGSSITYFESWDEDISELQWNQSKFEGIIKNLRKVLKNSGKLIIGVSRHYARHESGIIIKFIHKTIDSVRYTMEWSLNFDWEIRKKTWDCIINNNNGDNFSFKLISHLLDLNELMDICKKVFSNVRQQDIDSSFYDTFLICSND